MQDHQAANFWRQLNEEERRALALTDDGAILPAERTDKLCLLGLVHTVTRDITISGKAVASYGRKGVRATNGAERCGRDMRAAGVPQEGSPYPPGSDSDAAWMKGWANA